jgi:hypothetical protein
VFKRYTCQKQNPPLSRWALSIKSAIYLPWQQGLPGKQHALFLAQQLSVFCVVLLLAKTTVPATNKVATILKINVFIFICFKLID